MGTSTPFGGGKGSNPLLPSWLGGGGGGTAAGGPGSQSPASPGHGGGPSGTPPAQPAAPSPNKNRYRGGRRLLNAAAKASSSDDRSRGFAKAARSYVKTASGGSRGATARAASDRRAASKLAFFLLGAGAEGSDIRQELRRLNLESLANRTTEEIFYALVDYICEPGGDLDEAYARAAYIDAICEIPDGMKGRLERPDAETINFILERFIANTVTKRIENAIGNDMITLPETGLSARELQRLFQDWVSGRVKDAMAEIGGVLRQDQVRSQIDMIYEEAHASFGNYDEKDDEE
ncbi:hypothetical protein C6558_35185 [Ensifer sp. NM-2]|uniref:Qat anti-phage system associated protein QatB n=1 Tax=Ensifer sp. NM-2 TaxID=2109730 RepID=UPI000D12B6F6|nr:Qat anti-phage system associated protein QatB [Ensifer sp. NM-2]PSS59946.1 hypothetical protein C6558_35185 [Ensifer sp. NM-2]